MTSGADAGLAEAAFGGLSSELGLACGQPIELGAVSAARSLERDPGEGSIHVSFKLSFEREESARTGALLVPLADALTLVGGLRSQSPEDVAALRELELLDDDLKDGMIEVGHLVGGAVDGALVGLLPEGTLVRSASCQGVAPGRRPHLDNPPGMEYVVCRVEARIDPHASVGDWLLFVPDVSEA